MARGTNYSGRVYNSQGFQSLKISNGMFKNITNNLFRLFLLSIAVYWYLVNFLDENVSLQSNIQAGLWAIVFFFLIISVMAFPNGPFTRPHPAIWRCVFGLSVLYMHLLLFLLFQDYKTVRGIFEWWFPALTNFTIDMDKGEWGEKCNDLTVERLWQSVDFFCFAHFSGWAMKTVLVRHYGILWTISVMWEITELALPCLLLALIHIIISNIVCSRVGFWTMVKTAYNWEKSTYFGDGINPIKTNDYLQSEAIRFPSVSYIFNQYLTPHCYRATPIRFMPTSLIILYLSQKALHFFQKNLFRHRLSPRTLQVHLGVFEH
ncbi:unnamed protein product, partial [Meganyctiphanes norvegica]